MNPLVSKIDGATTQSSYFARQSSKSTLLLEFAKIRILCRYSWGSMFCRYFASLPVVDADGNTSFAFGICTAKSVFLIVNVFRFSVEYILFIIKVSRLSSL